MSIIKLNGGKAVINELYLDKSKRDARAKELAAQGYPVRRSTTTNQLLHPMYVEDYPRKLSPAEKGFDNTLCNIYFAKLYVIDF